MPSLSTEQSGFSFQLTWADRFPAALRPAPCAGASVLPLAGIVPSAMCFLRSYHTPPFLAPFLNAKRALDLVRENQQSSAHNFVKDFSPIFLKYSRRSPLKKGAATENPLEYGKTEVQILFEPLLTAISSMELPKNFENKKLPNTLR